MAWADFGQSDELFGLADRLLLHHPSRVPWRTEQHDRASNARCLTRLLCFKLKPLLQFPLTYWCEAPQHTGLQAYQQACSNHVPFAFKNASNASSTISCCERRDVNISIRMRSCILTGSLTVIAWRGSAGGRGAIRTGKRTCSGARPDTAASDGVDAG